MIARCAASRTSPTAGRSPSPATRTRQRRALVQPVGHAGGELLVDVLHDDDRRGKVLGKLAQQRGQHRGPARRGADRDQPIVAARLRRRSPARARAAGRACRRRAARSWRSSPAAAPRRPRSLPPPSSGVSTASSAPCPIASKTRLALTRTLPVTIRIAHGRAGHDAARRFDAVHARHHQVHQDEVRRLLRAAAPPPPRRSARSRRRGWPDRRPPRAAGARRPPPGR